MDTATEKEERRSAIESEFNGLRDGIEKQFVADREALTESYHNDLKDNDNAKRAAFVTEGLNADGTDPQGRQQGSTI